MKRYFPQRRKEVSRKGAKTQWNFKRATVLNRGTLTTCFSQNPTMQNCVAAPLREIFQNYVVLALAGCEPALNRIVAVSRLGRDDATMLNTHS
jgi:hypothetical protein